MQIEPLTIAVLPRLAKTGLVEQRQGEFALAAIHVGHRHFELPQGISYEITLTNTGEAVLLAGRAQATLATDCDRCLEPVELVLTGEVQGYFLFEELKAGEGESAEEYELVDAHGNIDVAPALLAAIVVELPLVVRCSEDCAGYATSQVALDAVSGTAYAEVGLAPGVPTGRVATDTQAAGILAAGRQAADASVAGALTIDVSTADALITEAPAPDAPTADEPPANSPFAALKHYRF